MNWVSIQPGLSTLAHHLSTMMGTSFYVTIVEPNLDLAGLYLYICPLATVINVSSLEFFNKVVVLDSPRCPKYFVFAPDINRDISLLPICSASFGIIGLDLTIYTDIHVPY